MMTLDAPRVAAYLGGRRLLGRTVKSAADLDRLVREGLPYRSYAYFIRHIAATPAQRTQVERVIGPRTTLLRREREGRLSTEESERAERLARIRALAEQVLESSEDATEFLYAPHPLLEGDTPVTLAGTDLGARRVETLLWQLEYGLPV